MLVWGKFLLSSHSCSGSFLLLCRHPERSFTILSLLGSALLPCSQWAFFSPFPLIFHQFHFLLLLPFQGSCQPLCCLSLPSPHSRSLPVAIINTLKGLSSTAVSRASCFLQPPNHGFLHLRHKITPRHRWCIFRAAALRWYVPKAAWRVLL